MGGNCSNFPPSKSGHRIQFTTFVSQNSLKLNFGSCIFGKLRTPDMYTPFELVCLACTGRDCEISQKIRKNARARRARANPTEVLKIKSCFFLLLPGKRVKIHGVYYS